ncbi:S1 RNA-binding domain-containing protein [Anaerocolumna aminovalerica]|uniref:S1 RNA-binding domain-containing protein n=1 Tax=Anaerocolumna aminovalerica TaxID=1527 RepID=UPI001596916C|nr:S1 RNA-binding domain-containing protein [Anaerocolumna aminovalerica]
MNDLEKDIQKKELNKEELQENESVNAENTIPEEVPSMNDFEEEISRSLHKVNEGELLKGTVIGISETEVTVDLGYYAEGIIRLEDLSNDPRFSIKADITVGEEIYGVVIREDDGERNILLSKKDADNILSWTKLKEYMDSQDVKKVKIAQAVNGGVVTYLEGIRGFIPASQLSLNYVEDLESWVNKEVEVIVITAEEENSRLVLSGKEVERKKEEADRNSKISRLQKGVVTTGTVEKIMPYGAFINIGDGLTGLVHISQICGKRIKSPNEIIKEGEEVTVKITDIKDGKISLSMRAVEENAEVVEAVEDVPFEYTSGEEASTGLGSLLSKIKL